jgi:hypothetical protein
MVSVEARVRAMTKSERRNHLVQAGWQRLGSRTWRHPTVDQPRGDRGFYTLAAAIRTALTEADRAAP